MSPTKKHTRHRSTSSKKVKPSQPIPLNSKILEILDIFLRFYTAKNDKIRMLAYNKAIHGIKSVDWEIKSLDDAMKIPGIGKGMLEKIDVILRAGTHPKIPEGSSSLDGLAALRLPEGSKNSLDGLAALRLPEMLAYIGAHSSELTKIMGFGPSLIAILKRKYKITTIEELDAYLAIAPIPEMSHIAQLGWKYRTDLATPIPRAETTAFFETFSKLLKSLDRGLEIQLAGSYPSGKLFSKDIDILAFYSSNLTNPDENMDILITALENTSKDGDIEIVLRGKTKFIGLVKTSENGIYRHVDIALYPVEVKPYAVLYFTSGKVVNQIMREKAKKLGYKLNEFGLFDRKTGEKIKVPSPVIENIKQILRM